jgi:cytochrome c553
MMQRFLIAACLAALTHSAVAADSAHGRQLVEGNCAACHGLDLQTPVDPSYPKLAGQYRDYLENSLHAYQTGGRKNPIMAGIAAPLSKQDIADLAAYISSRPGPLSHQR